MDAIVAVYSDWGIGKNGTQPVVLHADRKHFQRVTEGRTVIVGRKTLADLPGGKPLRGRRTIVVTRQELTIEGAETAHSPEEAREKCPNAVVIGGAGVYRDFYELLDRVFVTKIELCPESDSFFPDLDAAEDWQITDEGEEQCEDVIRFRFLVYERK